MLDKGRMKECREKTIVLGRSEQAVQDSPLSGTLFLAITTPGAIGSPGAIHIAPPLGDKEIGAATGYITML